MIALCQQFAIALVVLGSLAPTTPGSSVNQVVPPAGTVPMFVAVGSANGPGVPVWDAPGGTVLRMVAPGTVVADLDEARFAASRLYQRVGLEGGAEGWMSAEQIVPTALPADLAAVALSEPPPLPSGAGQTPADSGP